LSVDLDGKADAAWWFSVPWEVERSDLARCATGAPGFATTLGSCGKYAGTCLNPVKWAVVFCAEKREIRIGLCPLPGWIVIRAMKQTFNGHLLME